MKEIILIIKQKTNKQKTVIVVSKMHSNEIILFFLQTGTVDKAHMH